MVVTPKFFRPHISVTMQVRCMVTMDHHLPRAESNGHVIDDVT